MFRISTDLKSDEPKNDDAFWVTKRDNDDHCLSSIQNTKPVMKKLKLSSLEDIKHPMSISFLKIQKDLPFIVKNTQKKYTLKKSNERFTCNSGSFITNEIRTARLNTSSKNPSINNRKEIELRDEHDFPNISPTKKCCSIVIELSCPASKHIISPLASIKDKGLYNTQFGFNTISRLIKAEYDIPPHQKPKSKIQHNFSKAASQHKSNNKSSLLQRPSFFECYKHLKQPIDTLESVDNFLRRKEIN